ncbi:MAG: DUF2442 domain-containing protein [Caldilineaceae bacterium]
MPMVSVEIMFLHVIDVKYVDEYKLKLTFNNGVAGVVDLEPELYGEIFEPLQEKALFQQVYLTGRTIEWPNGADFAPEFLIRLVKPEVLVETEPTVIV